jgi:uncharacterized protein with PIN domain
MGVNTSAVMAILLAKPETERFAWALAGDPKK